MGGRRSGKQLAEVSAILKAGEDRIRKDERDKILKELARLMDCSERQAQASKDGSHQQKMFGAEAYVLESVIERVKALYEQVQVRVEPHENSPAQKRCACGYTGTGQHVQTTGCGPVVAQEDKP